MNADEKSLLLAFNGTDPSQPAVDYGLWLAGETRAPVTLLGIVEKPTRQKRVEGLIDTYSAALKTAGIPFQSDLINGNCRKIIRQQAVEGYHLTVFGPFDRPILRQRLQGRSFRRIFEEIHTPVLYTKRAHKQMNKILVCLGGLGYAVSAENWALNLAKIFHASVTLLHVVEPVSYDYPTAQEIHKHWEDILKTQTPQGKNLRQALNSAQERGIPTVFKVRHGDIVHEIVTELGSSNYDLVVMGSPSSSTNLRHLYMPNVTAEIAESTDCPVLAVKYGQEWIFSP